MRFPAGNPRDKGTDKLAGSGIFMRISAQTFLVFPQVGHCFYVLHDRLKRTRRVVSENMVPLGQKDESQWALLYQVIKRNHWQIWVLPQVGEKLLLRDNNCCRCDCITNPSSLHHCPECLYMLNRSSLVHSPSSNWFALCN